MNASGLYGERHGWYQASLDDAPPEWQRVTVPHEFHAPDAWVGWYRTTFDLHVPAGLDVPMGVVLDRAVTGADKALLFVNGYMMGNFWPERGPQTKFFVPAGILRTEGKNTMAIAVWRRTAEKGGLGIVRLEPYEIQAVSRLRVDTY
jgi:beta-galactosidase